MLKPPEVEVTLLAGVGLPMLATVKLERAKFVCELAATLCPRSSCTLLTVSV